jgi:hypothetical protein
MLRRGGAGPLMNFLERYREHVCWREKNFQAKLSFCDHRAAAITKFEFEEARYSTGMQNPVVRKLQALASWNFVDDFPSYRGMSLSE